MEWGFLRMKGLNPSNGNKISFDTGHAAGLSYVL